MIDNCSTSFQTLWRHHIQV